MTNENELPEISNLHPVVEAVIRAFDEAYIKYSLRDKLNINIENKKVLDWFNTSYLSRQRYSFFLPESLANLRDVIFTTVNIRDFLLDITQKTRFIVFTQQEKEVWGNYTEMVSQAVASDYSHGSSVIVDNDTYIMVPKPFFDSTLTRQEDIKHLLDHNPFFVVLFTVLENFEYTALYLHMSESALNTAAVKPEQK